MTKFFESLQLTLGASLPSVLGAFAVLVVGWLVAIAVRMGIRRGLALVRLDERVRSSAGGTMHLERTISSNPGHVLTVRECWPRSARLGRSPPEMRWPTRIVRISGRFDIRWQPAFNYTNPQ